MEEPSTEIEEKGSDEEEDGRVEEESRGSFRSGHLRERVRRNPLKGVGGGGREVMGGGRRRVVSFDGWNKGGVLRTGTNLRICEEICASTEDAHIVPERPRGAFVDRSKGRDEEERAEGKVIEGVGGRQFASRQALVSMSPSLALDI